MLFGRRVTVRCEGPAGLPGRDAASSDPASRVQMSAHDVISRDIECGPCCLLSLTIVSFNP